MVQKNLNAYNSLFSTVNFDIFTWGEVERFFLGAFPLQTTRQVQVTLSLLSSIVSPQVFEQSLFLLLYFMPASIIAMREKKK